MTRAVLLVVALLASSCATLDRIYRQQLQPLRPPRHWTCLDGQPVKVLTDPRCFEGLCGYSCEPERWSSPAT